MTFEAPNPDPSTEPQPQSEDGYVLSGRDRFAVRLIDAAVKLGSDEFQAHYRPVTEELFTHHFIDPKAKPAYVPPELEPVIDIETANDPLEVIRQNLDSVIEDRRARDEARINAETHLATTSAELTQMSARAADLEQQLTQQTARAEAAEAEVTRLRTELQNEVSSLHQQRQAEVAALTSQREAEVAALVSEREAEVAALHAQRTNDIAALTTELAELRSQHEQRVTELENTRATELSTLAQQHGAATESAHAAHQHELAALAATHEERVAQLLSEKEALAAQLQGDSSILEAKLTELRAELDAARTETAEKASALENAEKQLSSERAEREQTVAQRDAALEDRDSAVAERGEWENRLRLTVAALASVDEVGDWTDDNTPDERVVEVIHATRQRLESERDVAVNRLGHIERIATEELVDENETNDYAIGANDAAVRVLNALDDVEDATEAEGARQAETE